MHHTSEIAAKIAAKASGLRAAMVGKGGIFKRLIEEHTELSMLVQRIRASSDEDTRRELFSKVRREQLAHSKAEEREFYSVLREDARTSALAAESQDEHERIEDLVDRLSRAAVNDPSWTDLFERFAHELSAHVRREENEFFEEATKIIDRSESRRIERRFRQRKRDELDSLP
jgi:hemerythrin superfamily protein